MGDEKQDVMKGEEKVEDGESKGGGQMQFKFAHRKGAARFPLASDTGNSDLLPYDRYLQHQNSLKPQSSSLIGQEGDKIKPPSLKRTLD